MPKLIGNYAISSEPKADSQAGDKESKKSESSVAEFERRALERLGGSIAFVMKGKAIVWTGTDGHRDVPNKK
jgi:hypothetical protein